MPTRVGALAVRLERGVSSRALNGTVGSEEMRGDGAMGEIRVDSAGVTEMMPRLLTRSRVSSELDGLAGKTGAARVRPAAEVSSRVGSGGAWVSRESERLLDWNGGGIVRIGIDGGSGVTKRYAGGSFSGSNPFPPPANELTPACRAGGLRRRRISS